MQNLRSTSLMDPTEATAPDVNVAYITTQVDGIETFCLLRIRNSILTMRDVYCVNGAGRPLNSTSCIRLIGGQCIEMLALCICIHQVLATVGLPQKLLLTRTSTFYLHVCLAALNMLICITIGVVAYHRHSMASTVGCCIYFSFTVSFTISRCSQE